MQWGPGVKKRQVGAQAQGLTLRARTTRYFLILRCLMYLAIQAFLAFLVSDYFLQTFSLFFSCFLCFSSCTARPRLTFDVVQVNRNRKSLPYYFVVRIA